LMRFMGRTLPNTVPNPDNLAAMAEGMPRPQQQMMPPQMQGA
jgi:hypothetical protein